ncbi:MAG: hypothetical protein FWC91_12195 [Defluviitaleaceae bacterium]|nr:hypothetical protein [Defluviitaleaceae bacterium]
MAEYPRLNRSPFFNTFTNRRASNTNQNRQHTLQHNPHRDVAEEPGHLQHYALLRSLAAHPQRPGQQNMASQQQKPLYQHSSVPHTIMPQEAQPINLPTAQNPQEELNPQQIAERIQQLNRDLPDGVWFEPLDVDAKTALQNMNKDNSIQQNTPNKPIVPSSRGLPDGVRYEPIDEEAMVALKKLGKDIPTNSNVPTMAPTPVSPQLETKEEAKVEAKAPLSTPSPESIHLLEQLIQDERNASIYYQYLSGIAPTGEIQENLQNISKECNKWSDHHHQILQKIHGRSYDPKDAPINTTIGFSPGVEVAIIEERKILEAMAGLMDLLEDTVDSYSLQKLINRRMIRLNWLQWAMLSLKS